MIKRTLIIGMVFTAISLLLVACNFQAEKDKYEKMDDIPVSKQELAEDKKQAFILPNEDLQKGDQTASTQLLQNVLIEIGYPIVDTGIFDIETTWAITDFQLQHEQIYTTGIYNKETGILIQDALDQKAEIDPGSMLAKPGNNQQVEATNILENPYEILSLVNKEHALPADYIPYDLVTPNVRFPFTEDLPKKQLRKVAADALEEMFEAADQAGFDLFAQSGYRSYDRQDAIFATNVSKHGEEAANNFSARPGESEHQSGLTMDITSPNVNYQLIIEFGETKEGQWVQEHASDYGFIIRYPEGKEDITKYQYEPWHLRYVGKKAANDIMGQGITLEEYLEDITTN